MIWIAACIAAALLGIERVTYWWAWNHPRKFAARARARRAISGGDPVIALRRLFYLFKAIQLSVLVGWCVLFSDSGTPWPTAPPDAFAIGALLLVLGQALNIGVLVRLGSEGVFYGNRFGRETEWKTGFPFSFGDHPQYLGALLSVWGFMLIMRYPNPDWIVPALISTAWYAWGAQVERRSADER